MKTSACFRCQNFWHLNNCKWPPTFAEKKNSQTPKVNSSLQAVCSTCVKYQLNLITMVHLRQINIKDLRSMVRELLLGVKGRNSSSLEACLWLSALRNSQRLREKAKTYNYEASHTKINFGVSYEAWHLEFQYLHSDVLNYCISCI